MIETFIKPVIYNKNRPGSAEQIASGTYKNFDYYVLNLKTHPTAYIDVTNSPLNGCDEDIDISCHGGITWCDNFVKHIDKKGGLLVGIMHILEIIQIVGMLPSITCS